MKTRFLAVLVLAAMSVPAMGQYVPPTGFIPTKYGFDITDMYNMSQYNTGFGTARSAAMGGAFTSLGADLSTMSINPAGLGMYRTSEFGISPSINIANMGNKGNAHNTMFSNTKTTVSMDNIGVAFNLFESSGSLTGLTVGFGYNKLADYNYTNTFHSPVPGGISIADMFEGQLQGFRQGDIAGNTPWERIHMADWGAIMAYKTSLLDPMSASNNEQNYLINGIGGSANIDHITRTKSRGSAGEFTMAAGVNIENRFYFGGSIGMFSIYNKQNIHYEELYHDNTDAPGTALDWTIYDQQVKVSGEGVNLKLGAIYRPVDELRIGLALHTPTIVNIRHEYMAGMYTQFADNTGGDIMADNFVEYNFITPTRLMAGLSYTFGDMGILSVDYERTWYNGMRLVDDEADWAVEEYKVLVKNQFKGVNTVRVGGEVKPHPAVAIRGGFVYSSSALSHAEGYSLNSPIAYKTYNISGGLGFRVSRNTSLDMAYVYMNSRYTTYDLFAFSGLDHNNNPLNASITGLSHTRERHNIILTLGVRF